MREQAGTGQARGYVLVFGPRNGEKMIERKLTRIIWMRRLQADGLGINVWASVGLVTLSMQCEINK